MIVLNIFLLIIQLGLGLNARVMTKDELKEKLSFIFDEKVTKSLSVYVTTQQEGLQLFNIVEENLKDLLIMFIEAISGKLFIDEEYLLEDYSTSLSRGNVYYRYDMGSDKMTQEMTNMHEVLNLLYPSYFDSSHSGIETINGIYVVIKGDAGQSVVLYKYITTVDKTYSNSTIWMVWSDDKQFKRQQKNMLRISPAIHMLYIDDEIILMDLKKLERTLKLDDLLIRETQNDIHKITSMGVICDDGALKDVCKKPAMCRKLRRAMTQSKVVSNNITNAQLVSFARSQSKLRFHYSKDGLKFDLKTKAEAERFIKLMNDDFLKSELTKEYYDSNDKAVL